MTHFVDVTTMSRLIEQIGLGRFIGELAEAITEDFLRWPEFEKSARLANHSEFGVIELMPVSDAERYAFKYVNGHPRNTADGLYTVMAFGVLAEVATGYPVLLSELTVATALRTCATSLMAARALARPDARRMALIGNGAQSEFQAIAFHLHLGIEELTVYDIDPRATDKLVRNLAAYPRLSIVRAGSVADAVRGADIVTTVTADKTRASVLRADMLAPGMHINGVGGDCRQDRARGGGAARGAGICRVRTADPHRRRHPAAAGGLPGDRALARAGRRRARPPRRGGDHRLRFGRLRAGGLRHAALRPPPGAATRPRRPHRTGALGGRPQGPVPVHPQHPRARAAGRLSPPGDHAMSVPSPSQTPSAVVMIRPHRFAPNAETAADNAFQTAAAGSDAAALAADAHREVSVAVERLRAEGVQVHLFEDTGERGTPDSVFPNNWFSTHADGRIALYPMYSPSRRRERRDDVIQLLKDTYRVREVVDYSGLEAHGQFLEGTGAMVLDHPAKVAYMARSNRADARVLTRFASDFGFEPLAFDTRDASGQPIYHTNVMMCIATRFALVGLGSISDPRQAEAVGARLRAAGREPIELEPAQLAEFAGNAIELGGRDGRILALSQRACDSLSAAQKRRIAVSARLLPLAVPSIELAGGSVRCMIAGIHLPARR